ncbi:hypothetical protein [Micromonospora yangpuensis]|uniref:DUF2726 domain-containing protein n=1 Tax=Micromonospora yangpuensis TaxID=683228 RepID=A0A1C6UQZ8_9ACTN|nr:hypothetical protein [Micromonospora yangpuensis]GGM07172.1 hypothetical protein GCM10012279_26450 [Micromonospora yangpuensis]SCL56504.1 hypothetical protein GA0070617_3258 [Micromonospora yangpuensis]
MARTDSDDGAWLRALPDDTGRGPVLRRHGHLVHTDRRLGELVHRRPPGVTGNQWSAAVRAGLDLVVCAADTGHPRFAVEVGPPAVPGGAQQRERRMTDVVCAAVGLPLLRISSPTLRAGSHGRQIVGYLLDARHYAALTSAEPVTPTPHSPPPVGFRDILGRLPDGRRGPVNDLGALARAAAVEAYVSGHLVDPIVRGLHVRWTDGPAEGWSWVTVGPDSCLVERVSVRDHRVVRGVPTARLAEDLAAVAIGERLRGFDTVPTDVVSRSQLRADILALRSRRDEFADGFAFEHLCVD